MPTEEQISRWMWVEHGIREIIKHGVNYVIVSRKIWSANLNSKKALAGLILPRPAVANTAAQVL